MFLHLSVILFTGAVSVQGGGSLSGGVSVRETPRMVMCGQYASYWNAFLFLLCKITSTISTPVLDVVLLLSR